MPPAKMHYEIGELGHTDFRMMARRLSHFAPGGRLVMLPRAEFEALQSRAEEAERYSEAMPRADWHEEDGVVLWWNAEQGEPPFAGTLSTERDELRERLARVTGLAWTQKDGASLR